MLKNVFKHKKIIIAAFVVVALVLTGWFMTANADSRKAVTVQGIIPEKRELKSTISATGMVKSVDSHNVFSSQPYMIKSVEVSVGDVVTEGDVLAELDASDLELQIAQQKAALSAQASSAGQQINVASHNLENARFTKDSGLNAQIISAQAAVDNARLSVEMANQDVKSAKDAWDDAGKGMSTGMPNMSFDFPNLNIPMIPEGITGAHEINGALSGLNGSFSQEGDGIQNSSSDSDDAAEEAKEAAKTQAKNAYDKALIGQKNANQQLITAEKQLQATLSASGIEISTYEQQLQTARVNSNYSAQEIAIMQLEKNLEDAIITSPISGTVTAVYAEEGGNGSGMLFIVEDTNDLEIETTVSEYDLLNVVPGMKVSVKTDATGDEEFEGVVTKVSPTAIKSATGDNIATTNSQFGVTISVKSGGQKLKVGMNAKLELIEKELSDVYAVPYDVLQTGIDGEYVIYVLSKDAEGKDIVVSRPVKTGIETDFYVELVDIEFADGDVIITSNEPLSDGMSVHVANASDIGLTSEADKDNAKESDETESK